VRAHDVRAGLRALARAKPGLAAHCDSMCRVLDNVLVDCVTLHSRDSGVQRVLTMLADPRACVLVAEADLTHCLGAAIHYEAEGRFSLSQQGQGQECRHQ